MNYKYKVTLVTLGRELGYTFCYHGIELDMIIRERLSVGYKLENIKIQLVENFSVTP